MKVYKVSVSYSWEPEYVREADDVMFHFRNISDIASVHLAVQTPNRTTRKVFFITEQPHRDDSVESMIGDVRRMTYLDLVVERTIENMGS